MKGDVFRAIADPTRRAIIGLVAKQPLNVNTIADNFEMTRQAVSLHVKVLHDCGLLVIKTKGREHYCEAKLDQLDEVVDWVTQSRQIWTQRFRSLENLLEEIQEKNKPQTKPKKHGKRK